MTSQYGTLISGRDVRAAAVATIQAWAASYAAEVSRQSGVELPALRGYGQTLPEDADRYPFVVVVAPGLLGEPRRTQGQVNATWALGVGVTVAHPVRDTACDLAELYGAAIRALLVQHSDLGGFAAGTDWLDSETHEVAWDANVSVAQCAQQFAVDVRGVLDRSAGPLAVPSPVDAPLSTVQVVSADHTITPIH